MRLLAMKIYRPDTVSVADWSVDATAEELANWWRWASNLEVVGNSEAERLRNRAALRAGNLIITAHKRRGHIVLKAHAS